MQVPGRDRREQQEAAGDECNVRCSLRSYDICRNFQTGLLFSVEMAILSSAFACFVYSLVMHTLQASPLSVFATLSVGSIVVSLKDAEWTVGTQARLRHQEGHCTPEEAKRRPASSMQVQV